jgi:hypothetical protein
MDHDGGRAIRVTTVTWSNTAIEKESSRDRMRRAIRNLALLATIEPGAPMPRFVGSDDMAEARFDRRHCPDLPRCGLTLSQISGIGQKRTSLSARFHDEWQINVVLNECRRLPANLETMLETFAMVGRLLETTLAVERDPECLSASQARESMREAAVVAAMEAGRDVFVNCPGAWTPADIEYQSCTPGPLTERVLKAMDPMFGVLINGARASTNVTALRECSVADPTDDPVGSMRIYARHADAR